MLMSISVGVIVGAATDTWIGLVLASAVEVLAAWGLVRWAYTITISGDTCVVGSASLPAWAIGEVSALNKEELHIIMGRQANPAAYHMVRPWTKQAIKIVIADEHDPHPYWIVGTANANKLAAAVRELVLR